MTKRKYQQQSITTANRLSLLLYPQIPKTTGIDIDHQTQLYKKLQHLLFNHSQRNHLKRSDPLSVPKDMDQKDQSKTQADLENQVFFTEYLQSVQAALPVIHLCIEALSWGGAGKTQLLIDLTKAMILDFIQAFAQGRTVKPLKLALICHGYQASIPKVVCLKLNENLKLNSFVLYQAYGDEFALIYLSIASLINEFLTDEVQRPSWLSSLTITLMIGGTWQDKQALAVQQGYELCLYDGGGWRKSLKRQGNLILIDAQIPWKLIPFGLLKTSIQTNRNDILYMVNHLEQNSVNTLKNIHLLKHYLLGQYRYLSLKLMSAAGCIKRSIDRCQGMRLYLISAIAKPLVLKKKLEALGFMIEKHDYFVDHQAIPKHIQNAIQAHKQLNDLQALIAQDIGLAQQQFEEFQVNELYPCTTAKDYVKFPSFTPILMIDIEIDVSD